MRTALPLSLLLCTLALHCAPAKGLHKTVAMPGGGTGSETGSVTLVFSSQARALVAAINGKLVVDGADVKRLHVQHVASGYADIAIATQGVDRQLRVWVESGRDTSVPVAGPPAPPRQNPYVTAGLSVIAFLISKAATEALF